MSTTEILMTMQKAESAPVTNDEGMTNEKRQAAPACARGRENQPGDWSRWLRNTSVDGLAVGLLQSLSHSKQVQVRYPKGPLISNRRLVTPVYRYIV